MTVQKKSRPGQEAANTEQASKKPTNRLYVIAISITNSPLMQAATMLALIVLTARLAQ